VLESLRLKNWQIHQQRTIKFDPRTTTIIGPTDSGKSALLRALKWIALNQFAGPANSFIHWNAAFSKVKLRVDGHTIIRKKGKSNTYALDDKEFKAIGDKVPDEIANLLNLTDANFQSQFDAHFWISDSPGQVSRELNQIVNLNVIDEALASVASQARKTNAEIEICRERLASARQKRMGLAWTIEASTKLQNTQDAQDALNAHSLKIDVLRALIAKTIKTSNEACRTHLTTNTGVQTIDAGQRVTQIGLRTARLRELVDSLMTAQRLATLQIPVLPNPDNVRGISARKARLGQLIRTAEEFERTSCQLNHGLTEAKQKLQKATKGKCPMCGNKFLPSFVPTSTSHSAHPSHDQPNQAGSRQ
jgi:predicted ATP-dependent endonuclease of OLD family